MIEAKDRQGYYSQKLLERLVPSLEKKTWNTVDCRSEEGITIGLIDSLISISRVLRPRLNRSNMTESVQDALFDLIGDEDLDYILRMMSVV